jgi:hypothetical protein
MQANSDSDDSGSDVDAESKHKMKKQKREHKEKKQHKQRNTAETRRHDEKSSDEASPRSVMPAVMATAKPNAAVTQPLLTVNVPSPPISPRLAACRTLPYQYRNQSSPCLSSYVPAGEMFGGERLKPGLNISPRKLEKSPVSPSSIGPSPSPRRFTIGPALPPRFCLDGNNWP